MFKSIIISAIALSATSAFAQTDQNYEARIKQAQAAAEVAFSKTEVATLVTAAELIYQPSLSNKPNIFSDMENLIDCSVNPKPYGHADKSKCGFTAFKSYGWYADPTLVITVKGYVTAEKAQSGIIGTDDITVSEVSVKRPDPTGLE